jgi:predicted outer membrane repeat protein
MASELNRQNNVTMLFLNGNHSLDDRAQSPLIYTPIIRMIGENENVKVVASDLELNASAYHLKLLNNNVVTIESLVLINWKLLVSMAINYPTPMMFNIVTTTMHNCWIDTFPAIHTHLYIEQSILQGGQYNFRLNSTLVASRFENANMLIDGRDLQTENCTFFNTPVLAQYSQNILLSGITVFSSTTMTSAIASFYSDITLSGNVSFVNNSGIKGAAIALHLSRLHIAAHANITFANNTALQKGGAIYIEPGIVPNLVVNSQTPPTCFLELLNCPNTQDATLRSYDLYFINNSALHGGNDFYGGSPFQPYCSVNQCNLTIHNSTVSNSSVSSDPLRVCLCDNDGKPLCKNNSFSYTVHSGETFTMPVVLVGKDFGLSTGSLYANILPLHYTISSSLALSQHVQVVSSIKQCSEINISIYTQTNDFVVVYLTTVQMDSIKALQPSASHCTSTSCLLTAPVFVNFTILPCPPGFALQGDPPRCDCYPMLTHDLGVTCHLANGARYMSWTGGLWLDIKGNEIIYDKYCPYNYCYNHEEHNYIEISLSLLSNPSLGGQCNHNRAGILCGGCRESYSLAVGSSNCIQCPNSNNLALLVFFVVAGLLLVLFIGALNFTVTQGMVNGLIFYSNIVWSYKEIILYIPDGYNSPVLVFLKVFIAWVNLDFGIETCFVEGLTAFWKTWLQFIFPLYIFSIAGLIIIAARYSSRLTKLFGNRAVPLLATLFLLSYMKLLRTAVSSLEFSILTYSKYPNGSSSHAVWSVDGNLSYFQFPHILLFLAGLATLLFLWLPYTLLLLLMQCLRRLPSVPFLRWIMRLHPLYDAYFAPLKHKHQYWFGVLLLTRGILLVTFVSTFAIPQDINLVLLLIFGMLLIYFMVITHPYKSRGILILQISYLSNLTLLSGFTFFTYTQVNGTDLQSTAIGLSAGVVFLQFCGTVLYAVIKPLCRHCKGKISQIDEDDTFDNNRAEEPALAKHSSHFRDSIFDENKPLLPTASF